MNKLINASAAFLRKNSSTILTCIGAVGVIGTAVLAVRATPKALYLLDEAKEEKGENLTVIETVKTAAPAYIPTALVASASIACIFGANVLNKRQQASLISAYALLDRSYSEYRSKVKKLYGESADDEVKEEMAKEHLEEYEEENGKLVPDNPNEKVLFFDFNNLGYFEAPFDEVVHKARVADDLECYIISLPTE